MERFYIKQHSNGWTLCDYSDTPDRSYVFLLKEDLLTKLSELMSAPAQK